MSQCTPTLSIKEHLLFEVPVVVVDTPQLDWRGDERERGVRVRGEMEG